jgi:hypothetical protein
MELHARAKKALAASFSNERSPRANEQFFEVDRWSWSPRIKRDKREIGRLIQPPTTRYRPFIAKTPPLIEKQSRWISRLSRLGSSLSRRRSALGKLVTLMGATRQDKLLRVVYRRPVAVLTVNEAESSLGFIGRAGYCYETCVIPSLRMR